MSADMVSFHPEAERCLVSLLYVSDLEGAVALLVSQVLVSRVVVVVCSAVVHRRSVAMTDQVVLAPADPDDLYGNLLTALLDGGQRTEPARERDGRTSHRTDGSWIVHCYSRSA